MLLIDSDRALMIEVTALLIFDSKFLDISSSMFKKGYNPTRITTIARAITVSSNVKPAFNFILDLGMNTFSNFVYWSNY